MKLTLRQVFSFIAVVLAVAGVSVPASSQHTHSAVKADSFVQYITVADPYTKWQMWPDSAKQQKGLSPHGHGAFVTVYLNGAAARSVAEAKGMSNGSIIVVENYDAKRALTELTAMYKVDGYNRQAGDWYWLEGTPSGRVLRSGVVQACIDCHRAQSKNDYIWTGETVKGAYDRSTVP
jgi:hypothetical protein